MFRNVTSKDLDSPKGRAATSAVGDTLVSSVPMTKALKLAKSALSAAKKAGNAKKVAALTKKVKKLQEVRGGSAPGTSKFPPSKKPAVKGGANRAEPKAKPAKKATKKTKSSAETTEFKPKTRQKKRKTGYGPDRKPEKTSRRTRERTPVEKKARKEAIKLKRKTPDAPKRHYYEGVQRFGRTSGYGGFPDWAYEMAKPKKFRGYEGKIKRRPRPQPEY